MASTLTVLQHPLAVALGWSLVHFAWQGTLIAAIVAVVSLTMRRATPHLRYLTLCGGLLAMLAFPAATLLWQLRSSNPPVHSPSVPVASKERAPAPATTPAASLTPVRKEVIAETSFAPPLPTPKAFIPQTISPAESIPVSRLERVRGIVEPLLPWLVIGWLVGVTVLSLRLLEAWRRLRKMRRSATTSAPSIWQERLEQLAHRLRIGRPVTLIESALVEVPAVIGWLKPLILLPTSALTGLEPRHLEALLAHELAHVRRHDYFVNLLQTVIETLLFYHPAVWWLSRKIREEREHCCDDLAVTICGDSMTYARALATMEELRTAPVLTLAADGGSLLARIQRIVSRASRPAATTRPPLAPSGFAIVSLGGLCLTAAIAVTVSGRSAAIAQAEETSETVVAADSGNDGRLLHPGNPTDGKLKALIEKLRQEEDRFRVYSATVTTSHSFRKSFREDAAIFISGPDSGSEVNSETVARHVVDGNRYRFVGEDNSTTSSGGNSRSIQNWICNGTETISVFEGSCTTRYPGRVEPALMTPPHTWGMFHLAVSFPLSVYLSGTEEWNSHPKVGRQPHEGDSIYEFNAAQAELVNEEVVDGLDCAVLLVKRWYDTALPPGHQYLWLARDRNLHVAQSRTAFLRDGQEVPQAESRVKNWRKLDDGVWLPEVVEVVEISPEAVARKGTAQVVQRLTLEAATRQPKTTDKMFELPAVPAGLPAFSIDARQRLVGGPRHPAPIAGPPSTTLKAILERLVDEENKYDPCEVIVNDRCQFLNPDLHMGGSTASSSTRQRSMLSGTRRYREQVQSSTSSDGAESSLVDRRSCDSRIIRSFWQSESGKAKETVRGSAAIAIDGSQLAISLDRAHTLLFREERESANSLAAFLQSGWYDQRKRYPLIVEYVADEQIDELLCHKLKCSFRNSSFYIWLARDRNLIPIRREWHEPHRHATLPTGISFVEDLREIRTGLWFPYRITNLAFQSAFSRDGLLLNQIALQWRREVAVEQVTLDPQIDDRLFSELIVPAGTKVDIQDERGLSRGTYSQPETGPLNVPSEKLQELRGNVKAVKEKQTPDNEMRTPTRRPSRQRRDTPTGKLLDRLEQQNAGPELFHDPWLRTMQEIVALSPASVPELIEELDATDNERMLRCLGFMLRAIDDKRAVPALIRAIPKTLRSSGNSVGLVSYDAKLFEFARQHELHPRSDGKHYGVSVPVNEVCGALQKLTGQQFNEQQIYGIFLTGLPPEWRQKRSQFYQVAKTWADWWEQHWDEFVDDSAYSKVELPALVRSSPPRPEAFIETIGSKSGMLLQSVFDPRAKQVFYDIDTDQYAELPEKWRTSGDIPAHIDEILDWAAQEGFDLMGTEEIFPPGDRAVFALRGIGLKAWELDPKRWKRQRDVVTLEMLRKERGPVVGLLLRRDPQNTSKIAEPQANASFLVVTSERTPVLLHVGVAVHDDSQKPGTFFLGDPDLNPIGTMKGRRLTIMYLDMCEYLR